MPAKVDNAWLLDVHRRLLARDPAAPAQLARKVMGPLAQSLAHVAHLPDDSEMILDAVTDTLMSYIKRPGQFDPSKRGLWGFLMMSAQADLLNLQNKAERRHRRERSLKLVEERAVGGNMETGEPNGQVAEVDSRMQAERVDRVLDNVFPDPVDQRLAALVLDEERRTGPYATVLGIQDAPLEEQRRTVKRQKDRIKKRLSRLGHKTT